MSEQENEGKILGNFRAGFTSFASAIIIAALPFYIDETQQKPLLEQLRILSPIVAGGLAYLIGIPFNYVVCRVDVGRYKKQLELLEEERLSLDPETEMDRITDIIKEKGVYRQKIFEINSRSLFT